MSNLVLYAIPAFVLLLVVEALWARAARQRGAAIIGFERRDTAASLAMGLGNVAISGISKAASIPFFAWLYQHRWFDLPAAWWVWVALFFAEDFCYYWFHRAHHEIRLLWAAHINHHSSQHYNLSTALRQAWLTPLTGPIFWAPLALLGFSPFMILTAQATSLLYQFWIHTEAIDRLGPLEHIFNTPSHHRVHHGSNIPYLDRNHGGVLIIWDKLFGTFAAEREPVRFGLTTNIKTFHPIKIAFHELIAIGKDLARATTWRAKLGYLFGPPGWDPDGAQHTSKALRHALANSNVQPPAQRSA